MRLRRRLGGLSALLLLCICAAQAEAARAPGSFYGVMAAQDPTTAEIAQMGEGRVGTLRVNFVWGAVQPSASSPINWSYYDAIIGAAAQQGIRVLPTVYSSPLWVATRTNFPPTGRFRGLFRAFVRAAAERYGSNGTFWSSNPLIPKIPVIDWQLWNEMNSPSFWFHRPNPKQYVKLLKAFDSGVKSGDPSAKVVLGGLFRTPRLRRGIPLDRYLPGIYRAKGKKHFDAVAVHPYSTTPSDALRAVRETRQIMDRFQDKKAKLWVTEVGWATGGVATALTVSPQRQASYLRKTFGLLAKNRKRMKIAGVVWYSWRDLPGGIWFNHTGLFTEDLNPKPSWSAFVGLTGGQPRLAG
jgi:polysaccharide biosynthesis protein PslG